MQVQLLPSSIINCRQCIALLLLSFSLHTSYGQKFFLYVDKDAHFSIPLPESWKRTEHVSAKVLLVAVGPIDTSLASGEGIRASVVKYDVQNNNEQSFWKKRENIYYMYRLTESFIKKSKPNRERWKEVHVDGRKKAKCVGNGKEKS